MYSANRFSSEAYKLGGSRQYGRIPTATMWTAEAGDCAKLDTIDTRGIAQDAMADVFSLLPTYAQDKKSMRARMIADAAKEDSNEKLKGAHLRFLVGEVEKGRTKYPGSAYEDRLRMAEGKWRLKEKRGERMGQKKAQEEKRALEEGERGQELEGESEGSGDESERTVQRGAGKQRKFVDPAGRKSQKRGKKQQQRVRRSDPPEETPAEESSSDEGEKTEEGEGEEEDGGTARPSGEELEGEGSVEKEVVVLPEKRTRGVALTGRAPLRPVTRDPGSGRFRKVAAGDRDD